MEPLEDEYEYVVVGSGAGGGPVAANLARAGHRVLVLEAGGGPPTAGPDYPYQVPAFHALATETDSMSWHFFVRHYASDERQRQDSKYCPRRGGVFYPRAGTLGGCTAHNAMIFVAPANQDWEAIAEATGDPSWRPPQMRRYFERIEDCHYRPLWRFFARRFGWNPSRHGFAGWLTTVKSDPRLATEDRQLWTIVKRAAWRAFFGLASPLARLRTFLATAFDPNDWRGLRRGHEGIRLLPLSIRDGRRVGTRDLLLETQRRHPRHLTIRTGALVSRILFDEDRRAVGVEFQDGEHLYAADPLCRAAAAAPLRRVRVSREVILAAGAFNSPQLLQLSGVGPADLLRQHGVPVVVDLPGVGANLQDRYEVSVVSRLKRSFRMLDGATRRPPAAGEPLDRHLQEWRDHGTGIYTSNGAVLAILKKSVPAAAHPDLLIFGLVSRFRGYLPGYSDDVRTSDRHFSWTILKGYTQGRAGRVQIRSPDPRQVPDINFHYFDESDADSRADLEAVTDAVELVRKIGARYSQELVECEEVPGPQVASRDQIRQFVKNEAWGHHAAGTCKMGPPADATAVVDSRFRVRGTRGLRVVDASIFPRIPGLFIAAAIYIAAEKASDVILEDRDDRGDREGEARAACPCPRS